MKKIITAGARSSPLARAQVKEVLDEIRQFDLEIHFDCIEMPTYGDLDRSTSLRSLDKTDFFTKEIDALQLAGKCRIAIHSAKDLPEPLPQGLCIAAITTGIDPSDSLVIKQGETINSLPKGAIIATSSERREEAVKKLRKDFTFVDIRGTIHERLAKLDTGEVDGVVIAEAALIRLNLTHLNRVTLPGETVPYQGKLAVTARTEDREMRDLFSLIDTKMLYVGLNAPSSDRVVHCPLIEIVPRKVHNIPQATHLIFTSQSAVRIFCESNDHNNKTIISVGKSTTRALNQYGIDVQYTASTETAEGVVEVLETIPKEKAYFLWPHASGARTVISDYLRSNNYTFCDYPLYDTKTRFPKEIPNLSQFNEIYFTSPSTVDAFIEVFGEIPKGKKLSTIGPVTQEYLSQKM